MTDPLPDHNDTTVELGGRIIELNQQFTGHMITYPS